MRLFECEHCGNLLYFENTVCEQCGAALAFDPRSLRLGVQSSEARLCANAAHGVCNWRVTRDGEELCVACRLNRTIPDLSDPENVEKWRRVEIAKHRAIYGLLRLGLEPENKVYAPVTGLAFDFKENNEGEAAPVMTGHAHGLITLNIAEADDVERERQRTSNAEPFRTVLGHMRHELGHYVWDRRVDGTDRLEPWRAVFGDERADYAEALQRHYATPPGPGWQQDYVSHYAASHPWEDWAESWAHYLHMVDSLETAYAFGLRSRPRRGPDTTAHTADFDPYDEPDFERILNAWVPLTFAVNSLNRSMGQPDLYPFVFGPGATEKLRFAHAVARNEGG